MGAWSDGVKEDSSVFQYFALYAGKWVVRCAQDAIAVLVDVASTTRPSDARGGAGIASAAEP